MLGGTCNTGLYGDSGPGVTFEVEQLSPPPQPPSIPSPSPPNLPPPPLPPSAPGQLVEGVEVTLEAAGAVSDYDENKKSAIKTAFATAGSVDVSKVSVTITAGSVIIRVVIEAASSSAATTIKDAIAPQIATAAAATTFLADASVTVSSAPVVATGNVFVATAPPPPAAPSSRCGAGCMAGIIAGGCAVILSIVIFLAWLVFKKKKVDSKVKETQATVSSEAP